MTRQPLEIIAAEFHAVITDPAPGRELCHDAAQRALDALHAAGYAVAPPPRAKCGATCQSGGDDGDGHHCRRKAGHRKPHKCFCGLEWRSFGLLDPPPPAARPAARRGAYGTPTPAGECGVYVADQGGEWLCRKPWGHRGEHSPRRGAAPR